MITLLFIIALSSKSFDVTPEICTDVHSLECNIDRIDSVTVTVAESNVELEPVHTSSIWPSFCSSNVEPCNPLSENTQDETYFK
jgi:hypothetical protein